jgi:biotin synthase
MDISEILTKDSFTADEIACLLKAEEGDKKLLFEEVARIKAMYLQNKVFFRGLIEFSNCCNKNCLYCGIRKDNSHIRRYTLADEEILDAARFAFENRYGSIVLQSGERGGEGFAKRIEDLLKNIYRLSIGRLKVTLSCGEQSFDTYRRWYEAGADRYLLRIESSNPALYKKLHPDDGHHHFKTRSTCLDDLRKVGYQVGTGVMIGLPFQTCEDLANDLLFMKQIDVDMVGMGPYLEHLHTPLYELRGCLLPKEERLQLTLKMIAVLRLMMKDINIAATTALQAIDPMGREKALKAGANVIMPNITPRKYRSDYKLYENKPCTEEDADECLPCLKARITLAGHEIAWGEWGDSEHFRKRDTKKAQVTGDK